jgi:nitrite reductase/ring-hydroxylating ferredoxin subunit
MKLRTTLDAIQRMSWLDAVADVLQPAANRVVATGGTPLRDALDGTWLGTPLHPVITDVPIGSWTALAVLDSVGGDSKGMRRAADGTLAFGIAGAVAAAATGMGDARYLRGPGRRLAMAHALLNSAALGLNVASLALRAAGRRRVGKAASFGALGVAGVSAHLGGHLSFGLGLRVNQAPPGAGPADFVPALGVAELQGDALREVTVDGEAVLLSRVGGRVCAIHGRCTHMGGPLAEGAREGDTVVCPWHASRFELESGDVLDGPAVFDQPRFEARERDGRIELRRAPAAGG